EVAQQPQARAGATRRAAGPGPAAAGGPAPPPPTGPAIRRVHRLPVWVSSRRLGTRGRCRVAVRQARAPGSPTGGPPKACCTCRRAFSQRSFTVRTARPSSAAPAAAPPAQFQDERLRRKNRRGKELKVDEIPDLGFQVKNRIAERPLISFDKA